MTDGWCLLTAEERQQPWKLLNGLGKQKKMVRRDTAYLNESDGTKAGFSIDITREISHNVNIPVIASVEQVSVEHFREVFMIQNAAPPRSQHISFWRDFNP